LFENADEMLGVFESQLIRDLADRLALVTRTITENGWTLDFKTT
jgi:hypothetical protein